MIYLGADHGGYTFKEKIKEYLIPKLNEMVLSKMIETILVGAVFRSFAFDKSLDLFEQVIYIVIRMVQL